MTPRVAPLVEACLPKMEMSPVVLAFTSSLAVGFHAPMPKLRPLKYALSPFHTSTAWPNAVAGSPASAANTIAPI